LREAIINALIHRNYIGGEPTEIRIYPDYLSVWNYGKLPEGVKIEQLKSSHKSIRRNKLIADIFFKADLIEAWGRGTLKIVEECQKAEISEPKFKEEFFGFSVYFYKDIYTEENLRKMDLNERQI
jgi:ATP-dependent DNA helicase RecG